MFRNLPTDLLRRLAMALGVTVIALGGLTACNDVQDDPDETGTSEQQPAGDDRDDQGDDNQDDADDKNDDDDQDNDNDDQDNDD